MDKEDKFFIDKAFNRFIKCNFKNLIYGFVHGDIIETNVIKNKNNKLYFIDFSVSNYQPRIVDLAVTICDLCLDLKNIEESKQKIKIFLNAYEKKSPLTNYEKECLQTFIICHQAITVLETTREKYLENNTSAENEKYLLKGKQGLQIVLNENLIQD